MVDANDGKKRRGVVIKDPKSVRRVAQRIVSRAFQDDAELEYSGRIAQLLGVWLKAYEIEKLADIEKRLRALEDERRGA